MPDVAQYLESAESAARLAGAVLLDWAHRFSVTEKGPSNLVTEADFAAQEVIHRHLSERYPQHSFLAEEGLDQNHHQSLFRWIVDPLDGTSNYVHGFPYFAVSIGLEQNRKLVSGVVYDPSRDEMFTACKGRGTQLNGRAVKSSAAVSLRHSMVVASLPVGVDRNDPAVEHFLRVLPRKAQSLQRTGSAALNLAYVAAGRIDAFWSVSLKPWDMAAGAVLVEEAGGRVTKLDGSEFDVEVPSVLASNGTAVHNELLELLNP